MSCEDGTCTVKPQSTTALKPRTDPIECLFVSSEDAHPRKLDKLTFRPDLNSIVSREQSAALQFVVDKTCSKDPTGHST
ncbi:hypothetical protein V6N13_073362 [Hibiscus sabdariffa]